MMAGVVLQLGGSGEDSAALPRDAMEAMLRALLGEASAVHRRVCGCGRRLSSGGPRPWQWRRERHAGACIDDRAVEPGCVLRDGA